MRNLLQTYLNDPHPLQHIGMVVVIFAALVIAILKTT